MAKNKKSLPTPPSRKKRFGEQEDDSGALLSDRMAMAQSQGKLDKLLDEELGDNENARKLVSMMMGMSGMGMGSMDMSAAIPKGEHSKSQQKADTNDAAPQAPPEEIMKAAMSGDLSGLTELLRRESEKRQGGGQDDTSESPGQEPIKQRAEAPQSEPAFDRATIDQLMKIAQENDVSVDWLINRALTLYVRDHRNTGRL